MKLIHRLNGLYELSFGMVSAFLIHSKGDFILIDTGLPRNAKKILDAVGSIKGSPGSLTHILITQLHSDHVGSLAELKKLTGARVYAHRAEAGAIADGTIMRQAEAAPGLKNKIIFSLLAGRGSSRHIEGTAVDVTLEDGQVLDMAGGIETVYTPGHTAGHCSFLWKQHGGVLFVGDAASGGNRPGYPILFEDPLQGEHSLSKIAGLEFDKAFFAHGKPILSGASKAFADRWGETPQD